MTRKLKVVPFDTNLQTEFNYFDTNAHQRPYEIISPTSWELNTNTNVVQEQGILGNIITHSMPFSERSYTLDWVGSLKEVNKILNYFTKTSHRHFMLGGISNHNVVTPGVMFDSKGMLASVAEKYRFPGEIYRDYLPRFRDPGFNVGSMGVRVGRARSTPDFDFIDTSDSATGFVYLEANTSYTLILNDNRHNNLASGRNNLDFDAVYYNLNNIAVVPERETIRISRSGVGVTHAIPPASSDRIMAISLVVPIDEIYDDTSLGGIITYVPPIIYKTGTSYVMDEYEDIPSLLMPMDNFVYNRISPNVAELSMNFKEITHVTE